MRFCGKIITSREGASNTFSALTKSTVEVSIMAKESLPNSNSKIKICSIPSCSRVHKSQGFCRLHYERWLRHGDPFLNLRDGTHKDTCSVDSCDRIVKAKALCTKHYYRLRFNGSPYIVKRLDGVPLEDRFWLYVNKGEPDQCWEWTGYTVCGYGQIGEGSRCIKAHRLSFYLANGYWPEPFCLHSCDNRSCVNPNHLRAGTHQDNMQDAVDRKRFPSKKGEANHKARLTVEQVRKIRTLFDKMSIPDIAEMFNVAISTVGSIKQGRNWGWLDACNKRENA